MLKLNPRVGKNRELIQKIYAIASTKEGFRRSKFVDDRPSSAIHNSVVYLKEHNLIFGCRTIEHRNEFVYFAKAEDRDAYVIATQNKPNHEVPSRDVLPADAPVVFPSNYKFHSYSGLRLQDYKPTPPEAPIRPGAMNFKQIPSRGIG